MPTRKEIADEIDKYRGGGQDIVRRRYMKSLNKYTGNDTILYASSYGVPRPIPIPSDTITVSQHDVQGFMAALHKLGGEKLDLILHSPGGSGEAADQIVQFLRSKYSHIRAIIPQNAMSAATMIACACDEIIMGRHSAIGPIDPQMIVPGTNTFVPAHAILEEFNKARSEIIQNPLLANLWAPRFQHMPPGYLELCEQTSALSKEKVKEWLSNYMFKNGDSEKADEISNWLGDFNVHKTHGRPIGFDIARDKGLNVSRLEDDQKLQENVLSVFHAMIHTFQSTGCVKIIENHDGRGNYAILNIQTQNK